MKRNNLLLAVLSFFMFSQIVFAQPGSTFTNSDTITGLPFISLGESTCGFGDNYTTLDISCVGNFMSGDEHIYSFTATKTSSLYQVAMTNISGNFSGLFVMSDSNVTGTCMGSLGDPSSNDRVISNLQFNQGSTYYIIVSSWANPQCIASYDIEIIDNSCPAPSMLTSSGITKSDVTLAWTENGSANQWVIEYGPVGFVIGGGTVVPANSNPFVVTGLTSGTDYDWYVRANCGVDSSYAVGPESFITLPDLCAGNLFYDNGGANGNYSNNSNDTTVICANNTGDVVSLSFNTFNLESGYDSLKVYDGDNTSGSLLGGFSGTSIPGPFMGTTTSGCLTLVFTSDGSVNRAGWEASVVCMPAPTCPSVTALASGSVTQNSASISWVEMGTAIQWEIEYGGLGFTLGTGARVITSTNPTIITGLMSSLPYDYYVRAICGAADSSIWMGPANFTTLCGAMTSPYIESVETHNVTTNSTIGNCWTSTPTGSTSTTRWDIDGSGSTPSSFTGPTGAFGGVKYFYLETSAGSSGDVATLESPLINVNALTAPRLQFMYHMYGATTNKLVIEVHDGTSWNRLDSIVGEQQTAATDPWLQHTIYLTGYTGDIQIRFIGYQGTSYTGDISLDDIEVNNSPACSPPSSLTASAITVNSADLSWVEPGTATSWDVEYGPVGFTQGAGTSIVATSNPYTVTGLTSATSYDFYVRSICGTTTLSTWAGPFTFTTLISCPAPTNLSAVVSQDTATFDWVEAGSAVLWEFEYGTGGFALGSGTSDTTSVHPVSVNGLASSSVFDVYVRAICGSGDTSAWVGPINFSTPCGVVLAPITESFNASGTPNCWSQTATTGGPWITTGAPGYGASGAADHTGNGGNFIWMDQSGNDTAVSLITYDVDISNLTTPFLEFYYYTNNTNDASINDLFVEAWDGSSWVTIDTISQNTGGWVSFGYSLTGYTYGANLVRIQFRAESGGSGTDYYQDLLIDDISFIDTPTCPAPTNLTAVVSQTTATFDWVEQGSAVLWEVEYDTNGFTLGTGISTNTGVHPFSVSGLSLTTNYDVYVRAICGPGDTSAWVGPINFATQCGVVAMRYQEDFATWPLNCWDLTGGSKSWSNNSGVAEASFWGWSSGEDAYMTSPSVAITSNAQILFDWSHLYSTSYPNDSLRVEVKTLSSTTWTEIWSKKGANLNSNDGASNTSPGSFVTETIPLGFSYTNDTIQVRFFAYSGYGPDLFVDNFIIEALAACPTPTALSANVTSGSAALSWTEVGSATQWEVEYGATGFVIGAGIDSLTTNNPLSLNGLVSSTSFDFYVRAICGPGDTSLWSGPFGFQTTPDYCAGDHFYDNGGLTNNYANNSNETSVICPDNVGDLVNVTFNSFDIESGYEFLSVYDGSSASATLLGTFTGTTITASFDASSASGCLTFVFTSDGSVNAPGWDAVVTCNPPPSCRKPVDLTVNAISSFGATLKWTELGTATTWNVEYGLTGFVQGTGTMNTTTVDSLILTGLASITDYDFYVRSSCSAIDSSVWSGPFIFTTECSTINTFPYLETFNILSPSIRCWVNDSVLNNGNWSLFTGAAGGSITGPLASGYYIGFVSNTGTNSPITNFVSPEFDITTLVFPRMSFWYAQEEKNGKQNYTRVLYRISSNAPWVELWGDSSNVDVWTQVVLDLPNASSSYQIAFQGINNGGRRNVIDEFEVFDIAPKDLSVISVDIVNGTECGLGIDSVRATIVNYGSQVQNLYNVGYIFDGVASTPVTLNSTIGILDTIVHTFATTVNFTTSNTYELSAYSLLLGDTTVSNDTATKFVSKSPLISNFPYLEDYSNGQHGWSIDNQINGSWAFGKPVKSTITGAASDSNAFVIGGLSGVYNSNEDGFIYSPCFDFSTLVKPQIQMSVWYESEYGYDGANLQYSTDGGVNWSVLGNLGTGENWYTDASISGMSGLPAWTGRGTGFRPGSAGWIVSTHNAGFLAGEIDVKFRMAFASDGSTEDAGFAFDDFSIFEGPELGADTVLCNNESIVLDPGTFGGYYWTDSSITSTNFIEANALADGSYDVVVIVSGLGGYKMYDTINVIVDKPVINLGTDTVVCYGTSLLLDATSGFNTYLWNTSETSQTIITAAAPSGNTDYYVNGVTALGCTAVDTISVNVNTQVIVDLGVDTTFFDSTSQATSYELDAGPGFVTYLWSTGDVTQKIIVDSINDGSISVTVTNSSGCTGTDMVVVNFVLGTNSSFEVSTLTMYPNPATDQITIDVTNFSALDVINVTIVDITGKIVMIEKLEGAGNNFNETYDVSRFATGTYFVQFEANGEVVTRQFVIK